MVQCPVSTAPTTFTASQPKNTSKTKRVQVQGLQGLLQADTHMRTTKVRLGFFFTLCTPPLLIQFHILSLGHE